MQPPACNRQPHLGPAVPDKHNNGDGCVPITLYSLIFQMTLGLQDLTRSQIIKLKTLKGIFSFMHEYIVPYILTLTVWGFFKQSCCICKGTILLPTSFIWILVFDASLSSYRSRSTFTFYTSITSWCSKAESQYPGIKDTEFLNEGEKVDIFLFQTSAIWGKNI